MRMIEQTKGDFDQISKENTGLNLSPLGKVRRPPWLARIQYASARARLSHTASSAA